MLDELFERDGRRGGSAVGERPRGLRGLIGRLFGDLGEGDDDHDDERRRSRRGDAYDDDDGGTDRRRRERDAFDFDD